jgi:RNA polymerase sigma-70 factor, ECF subfamily
MLIGPKRGASGPVQLDEDSRAWVSALTAQGFQRDQAVTRLHDLLLRAARSEVGRRRPGSALPPPTLPHLAAIELDDLVVQAADDALFAVLRRLEDFRGLSRFTTWAYKFAVLEAGVKVQRRAWQGREVPLEPSHWSSVVDSDPSPLEAVEHHELGAAIRRAILSDLTERQRTVLVALAVEGVSIDVLAERLQTTRGALYKTLHDARQRLRAALVTYGFGMLPTPEDRT